ncbi:hypothetical protein T492DRAFT_880448, partial [Pavlovales sp. CCMP2436]
MACIRTTLRPVLLALLALGVARAQAPLRLGEGCGAPAGSAPTAAECAAKVAAKHSPFFAFGGPYSLCFHCEDETGGVEAEGFDTYKTADFAPTPGFAPGFGEGGVDAAALPASWEQPPATKR